MRDRMISVELTDTEMLLMAQAMYLASFVIKNPEVIKDDEKGKFCVFSIMMGAQAWNEYCTKMQEACVKAGSKKYL